LGAGVVVAKRKPDPIATAWKKIDEAWSLLIEAGSFLDEAPKPPPGFEGRLHPIKEACGGIGQALGLVNDSLEAYARSIEKKGRGK
jgi:hypothetical protein